MKNLNLKSVFLGLTCASVGMIGTTSVFAQDLAKVSAKAPMISHHGKKMIATVMVAVPDGFHIYSPTFSGTGVPTSISLSAGSNYFKYIGPGAPSGNLLSGNVVFHPSVMVDKTTHGKQKLTFTIRFQQCNSRICLPPVTRTVTVVTVVK